jgi:hypothetical protein
MVDDKYCFTNEHIWIHLSNMVYMVNIKKNIKKLEGVLGYNNLSSIVFITLLNFTKLGGMKPIYFVSQFLIKTHISHPCGIVHTTLMSLPRSSMSVDCTLDKKIGLRAQFTLSNPNFNRFHKWEELWDCLNITRIATFTPISFAYSRLWLSNLNWRFKKLISNNPVPWRFENHFCVRRS